MKQIVIILLFFCFPLLSHSAESSIKPSGVSKSERQQIIEDLTGSLLSDKRLLPIIKTDSIKMIRVYFFTFYISEYSSFNQRILPLRNGVEEIWFLVHTRNGDSVIASCESQNGRYIGLQLTSKFEKDKYGQLDKWLHKEKTSLSDQTLFFIGNDYLHIMYQGHGYVIDSFKKIDFNKFYKKKYKTIENFKKSFKIG